MPFHEIAILLLIPTSFVGLGLLADNWMQQRLSQLGDLAKRMKDGVI